MLALTEIRSTLAQPRRSSTLTAIRPPRRARLPTFDRRFEDRLRQAMAQAERTGEAIALHLLAVGPAGELAGPAADDHEPLLETARRIAELTRGCDASTYLDDGRFAVLQRALPDWYGAVCLARRLLRTVTRSRRGSGPGPAEAAVGIALHDPGLDFRALLARAEEALDAARLRRSRLHFAAGGADAAAPAVRRHDKLQRALEQRQLFLEFQPQVAAGSGRVLAFEALLRWRDTTGAVIPPRQIIPLAEQSGLILEIGEWILDEACRRCSAWNSGRSRTIPVAVNVSALQLRSPDFAATVRAALERARLPAHLLELELTETASLACPSEVIAMLRGLRQSGVHLALDDFGTGYSSLRYLSQLPVGKIKVPREFVGNLAHDATDFAVVSAVVSLADRLGLNVVAEGVETPEQLRAVRATGCQAIQGFLLRRPSPEIDLSDIVV